MITLAPLCMVRPAGTAHFQRRYFMAKDQFKTKTKEAALTSRFTVLPLVEKGDQFLCVDANFQFLMVKKERI